MSLKIVIVEDEKLTANDLASTIVSIKPEAEIIKIIPTIEEGIEFFTTNKEQIDLIFSDIQLGDGESFTIYNSVALKTPIVFCTAYNEYALQAFQTLGIDYILKPFSTKDIQKAIAKFETITNTSSIATPDISNLLSSLKKELNTGKLPSIILYQGEKIIPVQGEKIALFYIDQLTVKAITFENKILFTNNKLDELEKKFTPQFYRANRQFLVNKNAIKEAAQHFHRKLQIIVSVDFQQEILVGKEKATSFLEWLAS
jgi:two-component system, LytTR family, response regulator LytT